MRMYLWSVMVVLLLVGCSSMGEDKFSASYVKAHVIAKQTTKAQVQAIYGVPDDQTVRSDGTVSWEYEVRGNLSTASSIVGYIPGANAVSSALGMANTASNASDSATKASAKMSGSTEYHANRLYIDFDSAGVVKHWFM
ncbi:hypothetical protein [Serratia oryzae]|jgi:hypothetical protein|uniref:Lipoprotein SmpA/OmlA domain-containing protein n=1 Tax=Serratia oryzae TaxID=2034155 RepID=A0A1S8CPF0_9GAMM|nr:hypothetical protein [Serratia oryzae]OMQ25569.1 hypothetical protein BMI79_04465 [Serratia oryzae]VXC57390.1 conserved hypothetical protein [Enterobacterales bacterium 8AC]